METIGKLLQVIGAFTVIVVFAAIVAGIMELRRMLGGPRSVMERCACLEFVGDNPHCPVAKHREIWRMLEGAEKRIKGTKRPAPIEHRSP